MSEQETVKDVIKRMVKSINTIKANPPCCHGCIYGVQAYCESCCTLSQLKRCERDFARAIRKPSPEPPACNGCMDGVSINPNCDICRYKVLLKARHLAKSECKISQGDIRHGTAYDSVFPLKVSTLN